jgi:AcrR family transcriptional regulator
VAKRTEADPGVDSSASERSSGNAQLRRTRILESTVQVVRERGFAGTRVVDIARHADTSAGLVLYHFGSLQGALNAALTAAENAFYVELERVLDTASTPVVRLRSMAELAAGSGPAVGDWVLWLELWVRALRDDDARAARESLDQRWRAALGSVVDEGVGTGDFVTADALTSTTRLASLMDGLAIQLALADPAVTVARFRELWLGAAALELGAPKLAAARDQQ